MAATIAPTAAWLRECCCQACPGESIREFPASPDDGIPAAVLVPVIDRATGLTVLFTQRTAHLRDHAGQVSFPGGRCEPDDASPEATALRESHEEVGIRPAQVEILARLPDYHTGTGFRVTPVVGLVAPPLNLQLDDFEVADVFETPMAFLLDPDNYRREMIEVRGRRHPFWAVAWQNRFIWGATAGMLVSLRASLRAR